MKILTLTFCIIIFGVTIAEAQRIKKPKPKVVGSMSVQKPKVEAENWQEFDLKKLKLKLSFPKIPTTSERKMNEYEFEITSTTAQIDINDIFYLLEVREYPKNTLPKRDDLGESYAAWMKKYILSGSKILDEKNIDFGKTKGVEFVYQDSPLEVNIHRVFVVGQKLFQLMVHLKIRKPDTYSQTIEKNREKIDKFVDSLQLYEEEIIDNTTVAKNFVNRFLIGLIPRSFATEVRLDKIRDLRCFERKIFGRMPRQLCCAVVRK